MKFSWIICKSFRFWKGTTFVKCSHLTFLYIIGHNNISWRHPRPIHPKIWGSWSPNSRVDAYVHMHGELCSKVFSSGSKHAGFIGRNLMQIWNMSSFPRTADFRAEPRNLGFYDPSRAAESATEFAFLQRNSSFFPAEFRLFRGLWRFSFEQLRKWPRCSWLIDD